jgi:hypothetical protein
LRQTRLKPKIKPLMHVKIKSPEFLIHFIDSTLFFFHFQISYMDNVTYAQLTLPSPRSYARHHPAHHQNSRQNSNFQNSNFPAFSSSSSASPTPDRVVYSQIDPHLTSLALHNTNGGRFHHPPASKNCRIILNPQEKMSPTRGGHPYPGPTRHVNDEESGSWAPLLSAHQQESTL